nr:hypothetical protein [Tanacetum cinerariifolium]
EHLSTRIEFATQTALQSYTAEFEKKAQAEKEKDIDIIEKSLIVNHNDDEEEEHEEEYSFEFNDDEEEYDELYKDVDNKSLDAEHEKERKGDAEMTDADKNVSQERSYEQVVDDAHVTLTTTQNTKDEHLSTRIEFATQTALQSYTAEFEKKAQAEKEKDIDIIEKSVTINESPENVVLAKFSSQPQSTYEA